MYEVFTDDFYQLMSAMKEGFDFASYPKSSTFFDGTKTKVLGNFKDEARGQSIIEFVGLKPKIFPYQTLNDPSNGEAVLNTKKRVNVIERAAVAKLRHEQFKAEWQHPEESYVPNRRIRSYLHQLSAIDVWI